MSLLKAKIQLMAGREQFNRGLITAEQVQKLQAEYDLLMAATPPPAPAAAAAAPKFKMLKHPKAPQPAKPNRTAERKSTVSQVGSDSGSGAGTVENSESTVLTVDAETTVQTVETPAEGNE